MDAENHIFEKILDFIRKIEISFQFCNIQQQTFLPGLLIENGTLLIDKSQLKFIGDTLHEAGHIALLKPELRTKLSGSLEDQPDQEATEMAVIAWTYAACLEIGISPKVVFHPDGYKGDSDNIIENFSNGRYFGVPILQWYGMTNITEASPSIIYPAMKQWLR